MIQRQMKTVPSNDDELGRLLDTCFGCGAPTRTVNTRPFTIDELFKRGIEAYFCAPCAINVRSHDFLANVVERCVLIAIYNERESRKGSEKA